MILGTSNVFTVDDRTRLIIETRLGATASQQLKDKAVLLRAMIDMCIYQPTTYTTSSSSSSYSHDDTAVMDIQCTDEDFNAALKRIDPTGIGIDNPVLLNLVRRLLSWKAEDRITAHAALLHPYFHGHDAYSHSHSHIPSHSMNDDSRDRLLITR
jgi:serine/threonine protein kinase